MPEATAAIPIGIIWAWYAKKGAVPKGWAVCDGANGTPDLRGRVIRGVSDMSNVGPSGGKDSATIAQDDRKGSDWKWGDTPWAGGPNPAVGGQTISTMPPYVDILYIMKIS